MSLTGSCFSSLIGRLGSSTFRLSTAYWGFNSQGFTWPFVELTHHLRRHRLTLLENNRALLIIFARKLVGHVRGLGQR